MGEQKNHIIKGVLTNKDGIAVPGLLVKAFIDTNKIKPQLIGKTTTDENGKYQIEYDDEKLKERDLTGKVHIIVKVLSKENKLLKETPKRKRKTGSQTIDIADIDYSQLEPKQLSRLETLKYLVSDKTLKTKIDLVFKTAKGDWTAARDSLKKAKVSENTLNRLDFTYTLADLTDDQPPVAKELSKSCNNLREVALKFNVKSLAKLAMDTKADLGPIEGETDEEKEKVTNYAVSLNRKLYQSEPSAVLQRMVSAAELPIADVGLHSSIAKFFDNQPDFNISTTSIYTALSHPDAFKNITEDQWEGVTHQLKILQHVQAISPMPEAIPVLMKANLTSAYQVAELPESAFMKAYSKSLGETTARKVYNNAVNNRVRNEHALMSMRELYQGSGVAFIDQHQYRHQSAIATAKEVQYVTNEQKVPLNWEELFGSVDLCECDECNSVYSPSAYFVELLQYLRNNNLDPDYPNTAEKGIAGTPLEKLFRRRPDLACLELTCKNAFTVLPYIDLVNEVMESFVVHLGEYKADNHDPKQAILETFNVEDEITSELMAQPQYINYVAYCILKHAVYPFTLPYHQPIDAIRIFLNYLETSRYELMKTFRSVSDIGNTNEEDESPADDNPAEHVESPELATQIDIAIDRAIDAEYLSLTQEEYIILTKEAFCQKEYFDIKLDKTHTEEEYQQMIGVKPVYVYYGYDKETDMLNTNETQQDGLTFVKKQFLKRTGLLYTDLVNLLETQCINPNQPQGKALTITESIQFSYRFLQTLVLKESPDPKVRYAKLIDFLEKWQPVVPLLDAILNPDPCDKQKPDWCIETECFHKWVYCYFEKIGKLIVLESVDLLKIDLPEKHGGETVAYIKHNVIIDTQGQVIGHIYNDGKVLDNDGNGLGYTFGVTPLYIRNEENIIIGYIDRDQLLNAKNEPITHFPVKDTCDLEKIRLVHLNGTALTAEEYDRVHRFIRLWRKLGWTINEVDKALIGLAAQTSDAETPLRENDDICFDEFEDVRECEERCDEFDFPPFESSAPCRISPDFLHQLVAVKKLLEKTGLSVLKLLLFWTKISTVGEKSLYKNLFLKHNLLGIDEVFKADNNGNYLTGDDKISEHIPVLMAAFNLKAEDIETIMDSMEIDDKLTLANVSVLYHMRLLAKVLHVRIPELMEVISLFGDPFKNANDTLSLIKKWEKMEDAGFKFRELNYIIRDRDDAKRPLTPTRKSLLQLALILYDSLNEIDELHPDLADGEDASVDIIRAKASLLFEQPVVEEIINLLEGTTVYTTNAPVELDIDLSGFDAPRISYDAQSGSIQITGILTDDEEAVYKNLSNHPEWIKAFERVSKQALGFFNDTLYAVFPDSDKAKEELLKPDVNIPQDQQDPDNPVPSTAIGKRNFFIESFLPLLRERLTRRFLLDTLSSSVGLSQEVTDTLISEVLVAGEDKEPIINLFSAIKKVQAQGEEGWQGYLIPTADDEYTFVIESQEQPDLPRIDGQAIELHQQEDPSNIWLSEPVKLVGRQSYTFQINGLDPELNKLSWKTPTSPKAPIPASVLFPNYSVDGLEAAFKQLQKAALLVNGFELNHDEVAHFHDYASDFDDLDFNEIRLNQWLRLQAYTQFRNSLPETDTNLIEFFRWALNPDDATKLTEKIASLTQWEPERIDKLVSPEHFDLSHPEAFLNEKHFVKLQKAVKVADKIGMDIDSLFDWAKPKSKFWDCHQIAESIRKAIRARYLQEDWEQVVKPLNDKLRENQKQALISYLLVQQDLIDWAEKTSTGMLDTNSLFEFFLIDVQMESCMETSRIKQAISSVQLFVQRCFLGLEEPFGLSNDVLDRDRWEWMQRYRVWEANRKVFLYPENWIEPNLRDDKSPFFKELESELLQKDINKQTVEDALKSYLYKVDEVANLRVVGLFVEEEETDEGTQISKLHVFARTRNAPYFFFYRYFNAKEKNWLPWEKMQIDIPSYDAEDDEGNVIGYGTYLIPFVWNNRLFVFFPQFLKKARPKKVDESFETMGKAKVQERKAEEFWEIKMAWSEYRNGKWTQKQISKDALYHYLSKEAALPSISCYEFIPDIANDLIIIIKVFYGNNPLNDNNSLKGAFEFESSNIKIVDNNESYNDDLPDKFHYDIESIYSLQMNYPGWYPYLKKPTAPYFIDKNTKVIFMNNSVSHNFTHPFTHALLGKVALGDLEDFFAHNLSVSSPQEAFGVDGHELKSAYAIYNWELFFHLPTMLADHLSKSQQFEEAMKWYHFVFNPYSNGTDTTSARFWRFFPFKVTNAEDFLRSYFNSLLPNQSDDKITGWRNNPFRPHYIARDRPAAYMKWVVMKYLDNLIEWADYLFRQHTIETINQATQLYILAGHILGPSPQFIPKRGKIKPQTYYSLLDKWDAFSNAMVELELIFPFSNQTPLPIVIDKGVVGFANIFGFASSLYFCIPDNPKLLGYWKTIDDRLTKIRSCLDIEGVFRIPALFEPPIDPALLVQATAHGLSLSSVLNDLNTPMPNYRLNYLVQKALELCNELKSLGNSLLSALEKKDAEVLSKMRARHDISIQNLIMEVRKQQLDEAKETLNSLYENRKSPVYRLQHNLELIGEDLNNVPSEDADFTELQNKMEKVIDESGLKLIPYEKEEIDKASEAAGKQKHIGQIETLASTLHLIPMLNAEACPIGVGASVAFGGQFLGSAAQAIAKYMQISASELSYHSSNAARKGGFLRQLQDRVQQANIAGREIKQIDKQIITQKIRINIADQEKTNQQKQIDNAVEVEEFLKSKYTNEELYLWMEGSIRTLYYQTYTLAYDLAKKAEKAFQFERGLSNSNFIQFGYWDSARDGMLSGERLYVGLKQLETAYQEKRGHDYEVTKHVSLRQTNPLALITLKETGKCEFALPEVLFDMDFPGHYMRRIKSVAISIPCIAGPYTSINCSVRLLENKFRINAIAKDKNDYLEKTDKTDERFSTVNIPITSIAVSNGQNDSGVFELNFQDERYMPFEGAGAVSKWRFELPSTFRQLDYETITDVIMHIRYTAKDGGDKLKSPAEESLQGYIKSVEELSQQEGLFTVFDLKHDFPNEWHKAIEVPPVGNERILTLNKLNERLPAFAQGRGLSKVLASDITLLTPSNFNAADLLIVHDGDEYNFTDGVKVGENKTFVIRNEKIPISNWQVKILDTNKDIKKIWLVVRYILK